MNENVIVGLDVGYGYVKAVSESDRKICFPSLVAPAEFIRFQANVDAPVRVNGLTLHDTDEGEMSISVAPAIFFIKNLQ